MRKDGKVSLTKKQLIKLVVVIYILVTFMPMLISFIKDMTGTSNKTALEERDLEILSVSSEIVPEYEGRPPEEGYQIYRFDVLVRNNGMKEERIKNPNLYLSSGEEGYASAINSYDDSTAGVSEVEDTRFLPPGREGIITIYGSVSEDSTEVDFISYGEDYEEEHFLYTLPDQSV